MGQRRQQPYSRAKLPVGTVRIRKAKRHKIRMIKVREDGPKQRHWVYLARHWWLANRGPIPPGMRVVHADGDTLNDDPANYVLASAGDVLWLAEERWYPGLYERKRRALAAATARCNRDRARVGRALRFMPSRWYPVDLRARLVVNQPLRSRAAIYRWAMKADLIKRNVRNVLGPWLGWPELPGLQAVIVSILVDAGVTQLADLRLEVARLRSLHSLEPVLPRMGTFYWAISQLRSVGYIQSQRRTGRGRYAATKKAARTRRPPCPWLAVRGDDVAERFSGFKKVWPEQLVSL